MVIKAKSYRVCRVLLAEDLGSETISVLFFKKAPRYSLDDC